MAHKFDVTHKNKLDNPRRREMLPTGKILDEIGLQAGDILADIGCGIGYFSIPAAEIAGSKGSVYALDVNVEMIEELEQRIAENETDNIRTIVTEEYDFKLDDNAVSYALVSTVLHEIEDRMKFLHETKRILGSGGKIAIVEWIKKESDWGPPVGHRVDSSEVKRELLDCGFEEISYVELNDYFYIVTGILVHK
ncbi:class I SAM-dependent methyltransferase [Anaerobium acetethylicum]|uniref:Methyltransferase, FkbM family n=1 Tax=Anaerobium acetethylicum TaxID=1619234 RepID=A0A1D3TYI0_9FIRM|nr:class I SAM-dependent methyltransferase [Anaerobium acetethylicum]SCP99511.1 methyltransferase, FkbM family [Anaerobium acetethylicum]